jgi:hypothetical protein
MRHTGRPTDYRVHRVTDAEQIELVDNDGMRPSPGRSQTGGSE